MNIDDQQSTIAQITNDLQPLDPTLIIDTVTMADLPVAQTTATSDSSSLMTLEITTDTLMTEINTTQTSGEITEILETQETQETQEYTGYSVFEHDPSVPCTLLSSTFDRYNTSVKQTLEAESYLVQQDIEKQNMPGVNNFFRNAKWSPDGTCLLSNSEDDIIRLFNLPQNVYEETESPIDLEPVLGVREGETIYDFAWFPTMSSQDPATFCFLTSVRDHPVRLWDVTTKTVRASYCVIDHRERFIGPNVVRFNLEGSKIYCGYENMIEVFDVQRPGQESQKIPTTPKRRSKKGQKGIISCLDFSPDYAGLYAAGSYSKTVGIYDETNNEMCLKLSGIEGGVTQVKFSPNGNVLFTASRQADSIMCWDIRNTTNVLYELNRPGKTNQRISFDINSTGKVLITGDKNGNALFYDCLTGEERDEDSKQRLQRSMHAHDDITTSASFNPVYPVIATTSGQRKFTVGSDEDQDLTIDNSIKIWKTHGQYEWHPTV